MPWLDDDVPDRSKLVDVDAHRVFVVDVGPGRNGAQGPPILLVHGLLATHFAFDPLIPLLARSRRVIAVDLPGAGDSDRPAPADAAGYSVEWLAERLMSLAEVLGLRSFDVVGHDFGGAVAVAMASGAGGHEVRRLVLLAPTLLGPSIPYDGLLGVASALGVEVFEHAVRKADFRKVMAQAICVPELVDDTAVDVYWDRLGRAGGFAAAYSMIAQLGSIVRFRDVLRGLNTPTGIVWGDRDRIVPCEQAARLAELFPARPPVEVFEACGHQLARERPQLLAARLESWLSAEGFAAAGAL